MDALELSWRPGRGNTARCKKIRKKETSGSEQNLAFVERKKGSACGNGKGGPHEVNVVAEKKRKGTCIVRGRVSGGGSGGGGGQFNLAKTKSAGERPATRTKKQKEKFDRWESCPKNNNTKKQKKKKNKKTHNPHLKKRHVREG